MFSQEHGEGFVKATAQYLQRKLPNILQGPLKEESLIKANLPKEAIVALLYCLQQVTPALNTNDLKETCVAMIQNSQPLLAQMGGPKSRPPGSGSAAPGTGPPVGPVRPTPRPPPPTLMQLSNVHQQDPLGGLTNQLGDRLNLGTAPVVSSSGMSSGGSAFSALPTAGNFRNMAPSPGSPSRMFGAPGAPVPHTPTDGGSSPSLFNLGRYVYLLIYYYEADIVRQLDYYVALKFPKKYMTSYKVNGNYNWTILYVFILAKHVDCRASLM